MKRSHSETIEALPKGEWSRAILSCKDRADASALVCRLLNTSPSTTERSCTHCVRSFGEEGASRPCTSCGEVYRLTRQWQRETVIAALDVVLSEHEVIRAESEFNGSPLVVTTAMRRKWCDIMKFVGEVVKVGNFPLPDALWHKITRCATGPLVLLVQTTTWMNNDIFDSIASFIKSAVERKALVPSFGTVVGENKSVVEYLRLVHTDSLKNKITLLVDAVDRRWSNWSVTSEGDYIRALEGYKLKSSTTLTSTHAFKNNSTVTSPAVTKRMQHEIRDLTRHLPIHPESSIYVVYDDKRSDLLKAMITGPVGTPYANGCFVFDIHVSSTYPNAPPKVKFMTTGGGKIRFNPNLYANGKVCLSLLGTWRGPGWKAKESNIRQVLLSIQGLVLVPHPYFNEPGFEGSMNTSQGSRASETYNQSIRSHCLRTAILNMMRKPPVGLEEVVRLHFQYRADQILYQLEEWEASADAGHKPAVSKTSSELRPLLEAARRQRVDIPPEVIDLDDD